MKAEITEDFKSLCRAVLNGSVIPEQRDGEPDGYTISKVGGVSIYGYPWLSAESVAKSVMNSGITLYGYVDGSFYWIHAKSKDNSKSIGCTYSMNGKKWSEQNYFKFPARVALESLKTRLDMGLV